MANKKLKDLPALNVKRLSSKAGDAIDPLLSSIPVEIKEDNKDMFCCTESHRKDLADSKKIFYKRTHTIPIVNACQSVPCQKDTNDTSESF